MFVKVTNTYNDVEYYLNLDHVESMFWRDDLKRTHIYIHGESDYEPSYRVYETPEQILGLEGNK